MRLAPAIGLFLVTGVAIFAAVPLAHAQRYDQYNAPPSQGNGALAPSNNNQYSSDPYSLPGGTGAQNGTGGSVSPPSAQPDRFGGNQYPPPSTRSNDINQPSSSYREPAGTPPTGSAANLSSTGSNATTAVGKTPAEELMTAMLTRPTSSQLSGTPLTLREVIQSAPSRANQSQRINAYWDLCSATSDYYLSLHEQNELQRIARGTGGSTASLRDALQRLETRRDTSLTAARASQHHLASLMGRAGSLALPADMPLCTPYQTRFEENFGAAAPPEAVELNRLLPLRYAELRDAATNVERSEQRFTQVVQRSMGNLSAAEGDIVASIELLALNRRAFVQIARDYNRRITRYTELAKPGDLGATRLVAMLIKTDVDATARRENTPPGDGRQSQFGPPSTFREPNYGQEPHFAAPPENEEVRPATFDAPGNFQPIAPLEPLGPREPLEESVLNGQRGG